MAERIKLTFLGTGSAVPTEKRNHPAVLITFKEENILIDCGEGTQRQFRKAKINPGKLTRILITHFHADHCLGLVGLIQTLIINGYNKKLIIYTPKGAGIKIKEFLELFVPKRNRETYGVIEVNQGTIFENKEIKIVCGKGLHNVPSNIYSFIRKEKRRIDKNKLEKLKIPHSPLIAKLSEGKTIYYKGKKIDGKKITYIEPQKKISIILDTIFDKSLIKFCKNSDILICESTFSSEKKELAKKYFHLTTEDASLIAKKSKSKKLFLIHLSQRYELLSEEIEKEVKKSFKEVFIPDDFFSIEI